MRRWVFGICCGLGLVLIVMNRPTVPRAAQADFRADQPPATAQSRDLSDQLVEREQPPFESVDESDPAYFDVPPPRTPQPIRRPHAPRKPGLMLAETVAKAPASSSDAGVVASATPDPPPSAAVVSPEPITPREPQAPPPVADAGPDRIVWVGAETVRLSAAGSTGVELEYAWMQTEGPAGELSTPTIATPTVENFKASENQWLDQTVSFMVLVTDAAGRESVDTVTLSLRAAPDLALLPDGDGNSNCRKYFRKVDGSNLPHFECTLYQPADGIARFALDAGAPLTLTPLTGALHNFQQSFESGRHLYEIRLYQSSDESQSRLSFFAETDNHVPAIITLIAEW